MKVGKFRGYDIFVSDKKEKKYYAVGPHSKKKIYFGSATYQQYHDKMGHYKHLDHGDKERRRLFKARHNKNRHKVGSPAWFSSNILW